MAELRNNNLAFVLHLRETVIVSSIILGDFHKTQDGKDIFVFLLIWIWQNVG